MFLTNQILIKEKRQNICLCRLCGEIILRVLVAGLIDSRGPRFFGLTSEAGSAGVVSVQRERGSAALTFLSTLFTFECNHYISLKRSVWNLRPQVDGKLCCFSFRVCFPR